MALETRTARLIEWREIAPAVRHFIFDVPDLASLEYRAGQFVSFSREFAGKRITRAYSTASPANGNRFELCLNIVEGGHFSPHLFALHPGDTVEMKGPLGTFTLRQPPSDTILVATGTGIAPFRGMLLESGTGLEERQVTLILGARHEYGLLYRSEFEEAARRNPKFRFWPTLSRPEPSWLGRTGHVQSHVLAALGERRDLDVYICGLAAMVDDMRAQLKALGFDRKRILFERYD